MKAGGMYFAPVPQAVWVRRASMLAAEASLRDHSPQRHLHDRLREALQERPLTEGGKFLPRMNLGGQGHVPAGRPSRSNASTSSLPRQAPPKPLPRTQSDLGWTESRMPKIGGAASPATQLRSAARVRWQNVSSTAPEARALSDEIREFCESAPAGFRFVSVGKPTHTPWLKASKPILRHDRASPKSPSKKTEMVDEAETEVTPPKQITALSVDIKSSRRRSLLALKVSSKSRKSLAETEERWQDVYQRFKVDGEIHKDALRGALGSSGFEPPNAEWELDCASAITTYNSLSHVQFIDFMRAYDRRRREEFVALFKQFDSNDSGTLDLQELIPLFELCQITPVEHVVKAIMEEVDEDCKGELDIEEFLDCVDLLQSRYGFTKVEVEAFSDVFCKYDLEDSGELSTIELVGALNVLGYTIPEENVHEIHKKLDSDGSGSLHWDEFLLCVRRVREHEMAMILECIEENDTNGNGTLNIVELQDMLSGMGYYPDLFAIKDSMEDAGLGGMQELNLSCIARFLVVFRGREGLSRNDSDLIKETLKKLDKKGFGHLKILDVVKLLRYMGYPITWQWEKFNLLVRQVDIDRSGTLDLAELRKIVRLYREQDVHDVQLVFASHDSDGDGWLSNLEAQEAIHQLFGHQAQGIVYSADKYDSITFTNLALHEWHTWRVDYMKANAGYSNNEIEDLKDCFNKYDDDGNGDLSPQKWRNLIQDILARGNLRRADLENIMKEADDLSGEFVFKEFVHLMRRIEHLTDHNRVQKENKIIGEVGFNTFEVEDFREIFVGEDTSNPRDRMDFEDFSEMLGVIVPLGDKNVQELDVLFQGIVPKDKEERRADFPEFLLLIHTLLRGDFAGILSVVGPMAKKKETMQRRTSLMRARSSMVSAAQRYSVRKRNVDIAMQQIFENSPRQDSRKKKGVHRTVSRPQTSIA